jgi:fructose-bisphosphate aldolase class II
VLHGSSGVAEAGLVAAVRCGITKIDISTHLNKAFTDAVRTALTGDDALVDPRTYLGRGREAVAREVCHLLGVLGSPRSDR